MHIRGTRTEQPRQALLCETLWWMRLAAYATYNNPRANVL